MARWTSAVLLAMLGLALALPAEAQWKWRDQRGQTQYSDLPPPPGVPEHDILSRPAGARSRVAVLAASAPASGAAPAAAAASSALAPKTTDPELEARRKKAEAEQAAKAKAEEARVAAARADNCRRAQSHMRTLDSGIRIARTNDKGEREILDDQQRADEVRRTREVIATDCR